MKTAVTLFHNYRSEIFFWLAIFCLNFLLFLPIYLFYDYRSTFLPIFDGTGVFSNERLNSLFVTRTNLDVFRFHLEWFVLVGLWLWFRPLRKQWVLTLFFLFYVVQLIYMIYEGFIRSFYLLEPDFFNDYYLFLDLTQYVIKNLNLPLLVYIGAPFVLVGVFYLLYRLFRVVFIHLTPKQMSLFSKTAVAAFITLLLSASIVSGEALGHPDTAVASFAAKINDNLALSEISKTNLARFDKDEIAQTYNYTNLDLAERPDVHIIFVESYGSVLYKRPDFMLSTQTLLFGLQQELDQSGWHVASNRSEAPTWGGGSWLSYTSAISGLRLESHAEYLSLLNRYRDEPFPHLINYFRSQGYRTYRLSAISRDLNDYELQRYMHFYGFDEWLQSSDLGYEGPMYGWGPSLPDQYALHYTYQHMNQRPDEPNFLFYISQNSHYPWTPLPDVVDDWQTLNDPAVTLPQSPSSFTQRELRTNYVRSIAYEMEMLMNFIIEEGDEDDVFILIGDHQPARVARRDDGFDTPIHIISKNEAFVSSFYSYGFVPELSTRDLEPTMHHEGFYSLFMTQFFDAFGEEVGEKRPTYAPLGLIFRTTKE